MSYEVLKNLLLREELDLPLENNSGKDHKEFLSEKLNEFEEILESHGSHTLKIPGTEKKLLKAVRELRGGIELAIGYIYNGYPFDAYNIFYYSLRNFFPDLASSGFPEESLSTYQNHVMYRARVEQANCKLSKRDIFHIPFELRHKVSSQRFSIPGFPSLYTSNSIYAVWEELEKPDPDCMHVSKLIPQENLNLVVLYNTDHYRYKYCYTSGESADENLLKFILTWPLNAACSIKTKGNKDPFIPEYIIPQLLLQYVRGDSQIDGIAYSPTSISAKNDLNYVFPVQYGYDKEGYCFNLKNKFKLTDPITSQMVRVSEEEGKSSMPVFDAMKKHIDHLVPEKLD